MLWLIPVVVLVLIAYRIHQLRDDPAALGQEGIPVLFWLLGWVGWFIVPVAILQSVWPLATIGRDWSAVAGF